VSTEARRLEPLDGRPLLNKTGADAFFKSVVAPDVVETKANGIDYLPVVFPVSPTAICRVR